MSFDGVPQNRNHSEESERVGKTQGSLDERIQPVDKHVGSMPFFALCSHPTQLSVLTV